MFIDTHTHIIEPANGVDKIILVGTDLEDSQKAILTAQKHENVFATVGIHPEYAAQNIDWDRFEELLKQPKVVAIGECGLDYHQNYDPAQRQVFEKQLEIARKFDLPLSIHIRDAWEELKNIDLSKNRGVFHCYSGDVNILKNFYVSFAGNVTFGSAKELQELAKNISLEKILLETDSPYLSPIRGEQNFPENVKIIAQYLAKSKDVSLEEISKVTSENARKLFNF